MAGFLGRSENQMDPKGRVSLPAEFRRQADGSGFVLLQWRPTHLTLFPEDTWTSLQPRIREARQDSDDADNYFRLVLSMATKVKPDKQGRILVPSWLKESVGLDGTVLVNGNDDRIELWDPEIFREVTGDGRPDPTKVWDLARRTFG